jgi:hypothetical protein
MRTTVHQAHSRIKKTAFSYLRMINRHSDPFEFLEQPEEAAPFFKGVLIGLIPALLCWVGIIELALKFWR